MAGAFSQVPLRNTAPQIKMNQMPCLVAPPARSRRLVGRLTHCMTLSMADDRQLSSQSLPAPSLFDPTDFLQGAPYLPPVRFGASSLPAAKLFAVRAQLLPSALPRPRVTGTLGARGYRFWTFWDTPEGNFILKIQRLLLSH